jgi:hypothetical protein
MSLAMRIMGTVAPDTKGIPGGKKWEKAGHIVTHPLLSEVYPQLVEFIRRSRSAQTLEDHCSLQRDLAAAGWEARRFHEQIRDAKARLRAQQKDALANSDMDTVREISGAIPELDFDLDANARRWYALRAVQDGIIWRLLGFDRHRIAILGHAKTPVNWLSASFPSECAAAEEHWQEGRLALFCDLATCMNTGDLLVFYPDSNELRVTEVKESERASDDTRQLRNTRIKVEYLNSGYSEELTKDAPIMGPGLRPPIRTHLSILYDAILRAGRSGGAITRAGDAFLLRAIDVRALDPDRQAEAVVRLEAEERRLRSRLGAAWDGAPTYEFNSIDRIERDARASIASTAPFTIFPFDEETCAALLLGWVSYRTLLNLRSLDVALMRKGWSVIERPAEFSAQQDGFRWVSRGTSVLRLPTTIADELVVELLTLSALEAAVASGFAQTMSATANQVHVGWAWSGEARVWR